MTEEKQDRIYYRHGEPVVVSTFHLHMSAVRTGVDARLIRTGCRERSQWRSESIGGFYCQPLPSGGNDGGV